MKTDMIFDLMVELNEWYNCVTKMCWAIDSGFDCHLNKRRLSQVFPHNGLNDWLEHFLHVAGVGGGYEVREYPFILVMGGRHSVESGHQIYRQIIS